MKGIGKAYVDKIEAAAGETGLSTKQVMVRDFKALLADCIIIMMLPCL